MSMGFGLCCCDKAAFVTVAGNFPPAQFFAEDDRVFFTGPKNGEFDPASSYVNVLVARRLSTDLFSSKYHLFVDGVYDSDQLRQNYSITQKDWTDFRQCLFGTNERRRAPQESVDDDRVSFGGDLKNNRANDPGDHLFDIPERHGDLSYGEYFRAWGVSVDGSLVYRSETNSDIFTNDFGSQRFAYSRAAKAPHSGSGGKINLEIKTAVPVWHPCLDLNLYANAQADMIVAGCGIAFQTPWHSMRIQPVFSGGQNTYTVLAPGNVNYSTGQPYNVGDVVRVEITFLPGNQDSEVRFYVNGSLLTLTRAVSTTFLVSPASNGLYLSTPMYWGLVPGSLDGSPSTDFASWWLCAAEYMRSEIDWGTDRESGRWAGFDVEYDNIEDITAILINGRWTFRTGRLVKVRPTSWGMRWPIQYTATGLPAGLSISERGIEGTPQSVGAGTATITATDADGRSSVTTHNWDVSI